ncbi:hypothetical protein PHYBLDRAFT_60078 [Phycomyces blakesleeanus NRRL 1555(-)]|uniref:Homeodomain-like DNA binding domain-containing transcription factor n=1 Tax=Phycomyces blakesleeanus (strain ATCC 8743b / DSM 1359 / FGSC 10004 / NBRC 33097 / NRRL 1555) TaxID=763407 RepID=A0A167LCY7_PHYB8|nr:hypothetical protein PHYBLDRAFT_60078 [Phycomyces blakesleeanus NRRL 1555(-)]OAD70177.1 hypothetical protein PHYBLDRAFT_60078 [Phycomyces blakesleeanus NRRL 1555(-)]|eukprot:XP_018288217.1 hypothetical protein PHYBLDRAFT_60078 [Phycomyces blakesleeanus NRRL 1555(-)]
MNIRGLSTKTFKQLEGLVFFHCQLDREEYNAFDERDDFDSTHTSLVVDMSLSTVKYIVKRRNKKRSPKPRKGYGISRKIYDWTERHLMRVVRKGNAVSYYWMGKSLNKIEVFVCRKTIISYLKRLSFESYIAAHEPDLTEPKEERIGLDL